MAYITREDGERFVIPSYRDTLSAKKKNLLKREILLLSTSYGEYITILRKSVEQYEIAFSNEAGYLLGETVWHYFKRPLDLVYCEALPNTQEAILVVVKSGTVYLDGVFSLDSIADELIVFKTQQNNFNVYVYGNVPISEHPEEDKFSFDSDSVNSFTVLDESVFQALPLLKTFQLQLVDTALRTQGIGVLPLKPIILGLVAIGLVWMAWVFFTTHKKELPAVIVGVVNPYQVYIDTLTSPDPAREMEQVFHAIQYLSYIPGWHADKIDYAKGKLVAAVTSQGAKTDVLFDWANRYRATINILPQGFYVNMFVYTPSRQPPKTINPINEVIATIVDRVSYILPGNTLEVAQIVDRRDYKDTTVTIKFDTIPITTLEMIRQQLEELPVVLRSMNATASNGDLTGSITLQVLGN